MKIEILLATYNGEKYLEEQIESIINQDYKEWNLTIRDDNSSDKTKEMIEEYSKKYSNIKIIKDKNGNLGYKKNFEELLKRATGDIIFLCDQDDIWYKNKISVCLKYLQDYKLIHHNAKIIYEKNKQEGELFKINSYNYGIKNFMYPAFTGCCMVFKKEILDYVLPIPKGYPGHDTWIGLLAMFHKDIYYLDIPLITYRRHDSNTSFTSEKSKNKFFEKIKFRYHYIISVLLRMFKVKRSK